MFTFDSRFLFFPEDIIYLHLFSLFVPQTFIPVKLVDRLVEADGGGRRAAGGMVGGGLVTFIPHIMLEKLYFLKCVNVKHIGKAW